MFIYCYECGGSSARDWTDFASWALQRLEIRVERPTESHVGIISRSFKRFLLNEQVRSFFVLYPPEHCLSSFNAQ
jgi:hypothetical protein